MSYQAIYDAVRSKISGGDVGQAVRDVIGHWDISHAVASVQASWQEAACEQMRPFVILKPRMAKDGNAWICCYGDNIAEGVVGVGDTPEKAALDFDEAWRRK